MEPKIRFRELSEKWDKAPFLEIAKRVSVSASSYNTPSVEFEDINSGEGTLNKDVSKKNLVKIGKQFNKGDILFGKLRPYLKNILLADFQGIAIGDFWVLRPEKLTSNMLYILVNTREFMRIANVSSGSKMPRADWNLVSTAYFSIPTSKKEQIAIGSYFHHLDSLIQSTTQKIESLKQVKAASLQSMFPQEGETAPRVRFKGFEGDWKEDMANNLCKIGTGKSNTQDQIEEGKYPFYIRSEKVMRSNKYLYDCEAVITIGDGNIGRVFHYVKGKFDLHQRCYKMTEFQKVLGIYFFYYFSSSFYDRAIKMSAKATVDSVRLDMIANMPILYPESIEEQQAIADYFTNLDLLITSQTQRLDQLKQIKSACLDNMFV